MAVGVSLRDTKTTRTWTQSPTFIFCQDEECVRYF
jgi:hypothetical protein